METLLTGGTLINEGSRREVDILVRDGRIAKIAPQISPPGLCRVVELAGKWILPGIIDDQVHFREPGAPHKATIRSESRAAVAGGVTSYLEMPNTKPATLGPDQLQDKWSRAAETSWANYGFMLGASQEGPEGNLEAIKRLDPRNVPALKIFMGSSTGNMLVDRPEILEKMFRSSPTVICVHAEDDVRIAANLERAKARWGNDIPPEAHAEIRDAQACVESTRKAIALARSTGARLHVFHLSSASEMELFEPGPLDSKKVTAEACVHHLHFTAADYRRLGNRIKCNPSIKAKEHREGLWKAVAEGRIDVIATDHAPHTAAEKAKPYLEAPSGLPLVGQSLPLMLRHSTEGRLTVERLVDLMAHQPARLFRMVDRGFVREGYFADLAVVDPGGAHILGPEHIHHHCAWSPLEGEKMTHRVTHTMVSGHLAWEEGRFSSKPWGMRLEYKGN